VAGSNRKVFSSRCALRWRAKESMPISAGALEFLSQLEREEASRLAWGLIDGYFTEAEIELRAERFLADSSLGGIEDWELVEQLLDGKFLWRLPGSDHYRTRSAEAVRLFARLRQIFPDPAHNAWRTAPSLVADYRYIVRPRLHPIRDLAPSQLIETLARSGPVSALDDVILRGLGREATPSPMKFARFQARATERVLRASRESRITGTVVSAGTGTGKTLAFYMPAYARIAESVGVDRWMKCLAIYPRVELLKDQLREALLNARRIRGVLDQRRKRGLTIGALYADVPNKPVDVARKRSWPVVTIGHQRGYRCPFVRCPDCGGEMYWAEEDVRAAVERLRCASGACHGIVTPEELVLTRQRMMAEPPDVLFTSTEMLNQHMASRRFGRLFGIGQAPEHRPQFVLIDEVHAYEGAHGAHVAMLIRRWRRASEARPHFVGLSATLADASRFFADLVGIGPGDVVEIGPEPKELRAHGSEHMLALRGNPASGTSLPSTTIQALMLLSRILATDDNDPAGSRVFAFTDNLDGINRLYDDLLHAEGWERRRGQLIPRPQGSLANLRAPTLPSASERFDAGQNWKLAEDIGHILVAGNRTRIGRTTSQDSGVDSNATVIVATASLEVGYDDPEVGAVLQHKAPMSSAAFLQRKGRAGRRQEMRPWTIVALSDYGRDRAAYQGYDLLFSASLTPRHLPLGNRSILRVQAAYVLFEWLARKLPARESPDPRADLSQPPEAFDSANVAADVRRRQSVYVEHLRALLKDESVRAEFASFVSRSLRISDDETSALLWEAPRALLLEAAPTLLRRLECGWKRAGTATREPYVGWNPLPEFVPGALFGELRVPDVAIHLPAHQHVAARAEQMAIAQAMGEFAPGRVSRRFGISQQSERHWIAPGDGHDVPLDSFCGPDDRRDLGTFSFISEAGARSEVRVIQPLDYHASVTPVDVQQSSNSFLDWRTEIVPTGGGHVAQLAEGSPWASTIRGLEFHTHHLGIPVELRRFALGAAATVGRARRPKENLSLRFILGSPEAPDPVALGFAVDVDAVQVGLQYPVQLHETVARDERLLRGLRVARFRDLLDQSAALKDSTNHFQRAWLAHSFLAAVAADALTTRSDLRDATSRVLSGHGQATLAHAIATILQWVSDAEPDASDDHAVPKRVAELHALLGAPEVKEALLLAASALWEAPTAGWEPWLRLKFKTTLGAAIADAAQSLCPELSSEPLTVEIDAFTTSARVLTGFGSDDQIWLTEGAVGGAGFVEAFLDEYSRDPRRFFHLLDSALATGELEAVGYDLASVLHITAAGDSASEGLSTAMLDVRRANSHESSMAAMKRLRAVLSDNGIQPSQTLLVSMLTRFLGPGTGANTDAFFAQILGKIEMAELRLGIDLDARVCAFAYRNDSGLERALNVAPPGNTPEEREGWRFGVLYGMLWPRGAQVRTESLRPRNPFEQPMECDRLLVKAVVAQPEPAVALGDERWFEKLGEHLISSGSCNLVAPAAQQRSLGAALLRIVATPIDSGALLLYPCVTATTREGDRLAARLVVPEAYQ
jgi:Helicase conserved C-terminal domain/DEAD/DEAH box helicase